MRNLEGYEEVKDRLPRFWQDNPDGAVRTTLVEWRDDQFVVKAELFRYQEDDRPMSTGLAHEKLGGQGANRDAALENCETSAIGRALANGGFASQSAPRPSREEMVKVVPLRDRVWQACQSHDVDAKRFVDFLGAEYGAETMQELTGEQERELEGLLRSGELMERLTK